MRDIEKLDGGDKLDFLIAVYNGNNMAYHAYDKENDCLGAPEPLTEKSVRDLFKFVTSSIDHTSYNFGKNIIPNEVLFFKTDEKHIVWFTKPAVKEILFKNEVMKSGKYPLPYLLWTLKGKTLYVCALKKKPVSLNETTYQAPFMNVSSDGDVCMGNAKFATKSIDYTEIIHKAENAFFNSYFTHTNENKLVNGNFVEIFSSLIDQSKFPNKLLVKRNKKIEHYVNSREN